MNRVYCLYRVSTVQQLHKDDIPMQRQACQEFAAARGWKIIKEVYEKGISGFKTPTADRRVLQQIKKDAKQHEFDILLVFIFDRLGRRDSETPFFVEDLSMLGIEIWSAREGQQRFESHADKLINYIRYWQASGESLKISERTKTRMQQLTSEGFYCGGRSPYGYRLVKTGRVNPRGRDVHDLQIIPGEAKVIRIVFDYYIRYGYGGRRIATELAAQGIYDRNGEVFHPSSINAFLHRELFTGVMCRGGVRSQLNPELQIISPDTFQKAQQVMEKRKQGQLPKKLVGKALLSGNVYCGCCGGRVFASTVRRTHRVTEHNERIHVYKCYNRVQHRERCSTQSTYRAERIDKEVLRQLKCHVDTHPELQKLYDKALEAEFSIRKMILCQWIERVNIFTYDHIEVLFQDEIEIF